MIQELRDASESISDTPGLGAEDSREVEAELELVSGRGGAWLNEGIGHAIRGCLACMGRESDHVW